MLKKKEWKHEKALKLAKLKRMRFEKEKIQKLLERKLNREHSSFLLKKLTQVNFLGMFFKLE